MLKINKIRADHVIDFAAEELKKYLRMMMPECDEIDICYAPGAKDGFRLGLLEDFGLPNEAEDTLLDDVIHVDTQLDGGILAGSNVRSVLFAVYRLLRENGCRWLYPGVDGEHIPVRDLAATRYHKLADHRFRGHCNEGAESQQCMLETIDFYAKQEINIYMLEFDNPYYYYNVYYSHEFNEENRTPEPIPYQQAKQWKRQCEAEIAKRGLMYHDMGHGWTADPFGFDSTEGWKVSQQEIAEEKRQYLAMINGKREFFRGVPLNTNLCMSNPEARAIMIDSVVKYAQTHKNVHYLHVWLADEGNNHCECEECKKARPSDFYMVLLNELDQKLTEAGLDTRIVFCAYQDTIYAPIREKIQNTKRFSLLYGAITRSYATSISEDTVIPEAEEYPRNNWKLPYRAIRTAWNFAHLRQWQKMWSGDCLTYEYHFWRIQYRDPSGLYISRRLYEDIRGLKFMGLDGIIEDGSQRSFFPNGFAIYLYAEALMNRDCDYEKVREDYFRHIYGDAWEQVLSYLQKVSEIFDGEYMQGYKSIDESASRHWNPEYVKVFAGIHAVAEEGRAIARSHLTMPTRPQTVSMRMLLRHADYIELYAAAMEEMAKGDKAAAFEKEEIFRKEFGKYELELDRYFDHGLAFASIRQFIVPTVSLIGGA